MKKIILVTLVILPAGIASAQNTTPSPNSPAPVVSNAAPATASDVEALRQQVQSLTETVKTLQQQVKDQQAALEKANLTGESGLPQNPEPSPITGAESSPAPAGSAASRFPTEDTSVVSSTTAPAASAGRCRGRFSDNRHLSGDIGTGNDLKHGCWRIVNATNHDRRRQKLHEHLIRRLVRARLLERDAISITSKSAITIRSNADSTRATSSLRSTAQSILISKVSPTSFSNWTTTMKPQVEVEEAFLQTTRSAIQLAIERRTIFRRLRPAESNASAHVGLRR